MRARLSRPWARHQLRRGDDRARGPATRTVSKGWSSEGRSPSSTPPLGHRPGTALALARAGADVVVADIHPERTAEAVAAIRELGQRALGALCDVTVDEDVEALAATTLEHFGRVDVVMNNAGVSVLGPPERVPMDDWRWVLDVNLLGVVRGIRAFVPTLVEQGSGWIVNTASVAGLYAYSYDAIPYITSKHAVVGLWRACTCTCGPRAWACRCCAPDWSPRTWARASACGASNDPGWTNFPVHMQRVADPGDVGEMVVGAIRDERFLVLTHPEDLATVVAHGADRGAFLQGYLPRLYAGRLASGLPTNHVPPPEPVTPLRRRGGRGLMPVAPVNGIDLHYELGGRAEGPPVLLIGGSGQDLRQTPLFASPLSEHFHLLAYDQRCLGQSGWGDRQPEMADYAADAAGLLDHVGWDRVPVIGISFGGMVAQELAVTHSERVERMVLACTSPGGDFASYPLHRLAELGAEGQQAMFGITDTRGPDAGPEYLAVTQLMAERRATDPPSAEVLEGMQRQLIARSRHDVVDRLSTLDLPVLIAAGRYDGIAPEANQEAMRARIAGSRLQWFDGGHMFMIQDPAAWPAMVAFLLGDPDPTQTRGEQPHDRPRDGRWHAAHDRPHARIDRRGPRTACCPTPSRARSATR